MLSLYLWWSLRHYELLEMNGAKTTCTALLLPLLLTHIPVSVMWCACVSKSIWLCLLKRLVCCYSMMKFVGSLGRQIERKSSQASYLLFSQFCHPVRNSVITPVVCIYCYNRTNDSMQQTELKLWVAIMTTWCLLEPRVMEWTLQRHESSEIGGSAFIALGLCCLFFLCASTKPRALNIMCYTFVCLCCT